MDHTLWQIWTVCEAEDRAGTLTSIDRQIACMKAVDSLTTDGRKQAIQRLEDLKSTL